MKYVLSILLLLGLAYVVLVLIANRNAAPVDQPLVLGGAKVAVTAQRQLRVLDWNIGYAGLGAESEFFADGGNRLLAPSPETVDKNLAGIRRVLANTPADVYTLQELSQTSFLNYWRPVWEGVKQSLPGAAAVWLSDVRSLWIPWPAQLDHGLATLLRVRANEAQAVPLPLEPKYWFGLLRKQYALLVTRIPIAGEDKSWVLVNFHLAAFDDGGETRRDQLRKLTEFAAGEYKAGNFVVLAGDWNMVLGGREFPHRTESRFLNWVHPLPQGAAPDGWSFAFDGNTPSVRTLYKPYVAGENFVTVIDGFLVSPNVAIEQVSALDLGFEYSDHNPVLATFRAK